MSFKSRFDPSRLHVVTCISNPVRYESRYRLYERFAKEMRAAGVNLTTVEAAFGARPHEAHLLSDYEDDPGYSHSPEGYGRHLQLRTSNELWHKENMLNLGIARLDPSWEYMAWVDADITFVRPDWQEETLEALQHYPVVQMFETAIDSGPTGASMATYRGFASSFLNGLPYGPGAGGSYGPYWHSGFAWAARREAIDELGGLMDHAILGAADHHMALCLLGRAKVSLPGGVNKHYAQMVYEWQERARAGHLIDNIGVVPGTIVHHWHGSKARRRYKERWDILTGHNFDPLKDIKRDSQGLWQLTKSGLRMRNDLRRYFAERNEDGIDQ